MALVFRDRVLETSVTPGTGTLTLAGAVAGYQSFAAIGDGNTCYYSAEEVDANGVPTGAWEVGLGTYTLAGTLLARTSVMASSSGGAAVAFGSGTKRVSVVRPAAGTVIVRFPGGTPGSDEGQLRHDGSHFYIENKKPNLDLRLKSTGGSTYIEDDIRCGAGASVMIKRGSSLTGFQFCSGSPFGNVFDTGIYSPAAGVVAIVAAATGGQLEFPQVADVGTPSTNSARIGAEDVAGTAEMIVADEAGTETQISPHAADAPAALQDGNASNKINDEIHRSVNTYLGRVEFVNLTRLARLVEMIAAGNLAAVQALPAAQRQCHFSETLASYNSRTGKSKPARTWQQVQDAHQARYDATRAEEIARHDAWLAADPATRGQEPFVRPAADIRKAVPAWLAARGVT